MPPSSPETRIVRNAVGRGLVDDMSYARIYTTIDFFLSSKSDGSSAGFEIISCLAANIFKSTSKQLSSKTERGQIAQAVASG